jgi:DNA repair ATPase RecN
MPKSNGNIGDWLDRLEAVIEKRDQQYAERQQQFEKRQEKFEAWQQKSEQRLQRLERMVARLAETQSLIFDLQTRNERRFAENEQRWEQLRKDQAARSAELDDALKELAMAQAVTQNNLNALLEAFNDHIRDPQAHQPGNGKNGGTGKRKGGGKR